jgi:hypothetical protein
MTTPTLHMPALIVYDVELTNVTRTEEGRLLRRRFCLRCHL